MSTKHGCAFMTSLPDEYVSIDFMHKFPFSRDEISKAVVSLDVQVKYVGSLKGVYELFCLNTNIGDQRYTIYATTECNEIFFLIKISKCI